MLILDKAIDNPVIYGFSDKVKLMPRVILIHVISNPEQPNKRYTVQACKDILNRYRFSAHLLIGRAGDEDGRLYLLVPLDKMAYHAGKSQFRGLKGKFGINPYAIGIEVIGAHGEDLTDKQYDTLSSVCVDLMIEYNITSEFVTGHQMVADIFAREDPKWDPGPNMDWIRLGFMVINKLKEEQNYG